VEALVDRGALNQQLLLPICQKEREDIPVVLAFQRLEIK
jgi:hypothetical protein